MKYHSTYFDDFLLYLIFRGKKEKNLNIPEYKVPPQFHLSEQKLCTEVKKKLSFRQYQLNPDKFFGDDTQPTSAILCFFFVFNCS